MRIFFRPSVRLWMVIPLCAFGFIAWTNWERAGRVMYVTNTDHENAIIDTGSPTGYAGGKRWLIVPEHNNRSYQWIAETQQMLAQHDWRVRHVDYDNAPLGRAVYAASPYRWWLGLIAWCDHFISGRPLGLSVERAALFADPVLHLLLLAGTTMFVARYFGTLPAAMVAAGLATIYPFAGGFLPGVPDEHSLAWACSLWSILPLLVVACRSRFPTPQKKLAAVNVAPDGPNPQESRLFLVAGIAGGLGLWINPANQMPVIVGVAFGGLLAAGLTNRTQQERPEVSPAVLPWRVWSLGGAATCLAAYLAEYFPAHLDFRFETNHPMYGLAWVGIGELLARIDSWSKKENSRWTPARIIGVILAASAMAALPVAMKLGGTRSWLAEDPRAARLSFLPNGAVAKNFLDWIARDGVNGTSVATCLPLVLVVPAIWFLSRRKTEAGPRAKLALAIGPVVVVLVPAFFQLRWWNLCDATLLALLVSVTTVEPARGPWRWAGFASLIFLPGLIQLMPSFENRDNIVFTRLEVEGLIERNLAHWIADHADPGGAVVLLPPDRTASWCFHGGLRGLGSANWENREGLEATVRIATATTVSEASELINRRGVNYLVLPSWDSDLDAFAKWSLRNPEDAFISALHHWALPPWLRPLPYKLPVDVGFDGQSVVILKVTDESNKVAALGRLAEYFVESQQTDLAASIIPALRKYPTDLGALVALAQVQKATGDARGFQTTSETLLASLAAGSDRSLAWDRRVSLATVLAQAERTDLAREQLRRCWEKLDQARIRSLTTGSLFRLQLLGKTFGFAIAEPGTRELDMRLLPPELRARL